MHHTNQNGGCTWVCFKLCESMCETARLITCRQTCIGSARSLMRACIPYTYTFLHAIQKPDHDVEGEFDPEHVDHALFDEIIWATIAARVPAFEQLKLKAAWSGLYEYSTLDQNSFMGRMPHCHNLQRFATALAGMGCSKALPQVKQWRR